MIVGCANETVTNLADEKSYYLRLCPRAIRHICVSKSIQIELIKNEFDQQIVVINFSSLRRRCCLKYKFLY